MLLGYGYEVYIIIFFVKETIFLQQTRYLLQTAVCIKSTTAASAAEQQNFENRATAKTSKE